MNNVRSVCFHVSGMYLGVDLLDRTITPFKELVNGFHSKHTTLCKVVSHHGFDLVQTSCVESKRAE